jgi:catechol 2,3-dioxygenase-like lactoylglutathione lyase family enzyme
MNAITGLNHLTLSVSDLERSVAFYSELLGFMVRMRGRASAYLEAGTLWLALIFDPMRGGVHCLSIRMSHLAPLHPSCHF